MILPKRLWLCITRLAGKSAILSKMQNFMGILSL